jgi:hypothetical protein
MTESQLFSNFNIKKSWDSVVFALIFLNLTMFQNFSMFQTFSMFQKNLESLGHRKVSVLVFITNKNFKKIRQKQQSPNIFLCFSEKNLEKVWDIEKSWDFVIF